MRLNSALSTPSAAAGSPNRHVLANQNSRGKGGGMRVNARTVSLGKAKNLNPC